MSNDPPEISFGDAIAIASTVTSIRSGHCPQCGHVSSPEDFVREWGHRCDVCRFEIRNNEESDALNVMAEVTKRNLNTFETWRAKRNQPQGI